MDYIKAKICELVDANADKIILFGKSIRPEAGFEENDSSDKIAKVLSSLQLSPTRGLACTGVRADLGAGSVRIAILAELDGIYCPSHPCADAVSGISHACAHNAQLAALYGSAIALTNKEIAEKLCGSIAFFAVPAEEFTSEKTRKYAAAHGVRYMSGKQELIRTGAFDDIALALASHTHMVKSGADMLLGLNASCGYAIRRVTMCGKAAHAAAAPWDGVNALSCANLALCAIGLLRETFNEKDCVRIHTNITHGGDAVNVIPDTVVIEAMIRAKTQEGIRLAEEKFDTAMQHCAMALGAHAKIERRKGYMPVPQYLPNAATLAAAECLGKELKIETIDPSVTNFASTDLGDLASIMPIMTCTHGGVKGALHSSEFEIIDDYKAYVLPAKLMALEAYQLLKDGAKAAHNVIDNYKAPLSRAQYISVMEASENG